MKQSNVSGHWTPGHWTDEQLIAELYGVGPEDGHLAACAKCRERSASLVAARSARQRMASSAEDVTFDFLAAQRRSIYARLAQPTRIGFRRLASAAAALVVVGAGVLAYQEQHHPAVDPNSAPTHISDAQLASEVAEMGQEADPAPVAPIQELFE